MGVEGVVRECSEGRGRWKEEGGKTYKDGGRRMKSWRRIKRKGVKVSE